MSYSSSCHAFDQNIVHGTVLLIGVGVQLLPMEHQKYQVDNTVEPDDVVQMMLRAL